MDLDSGKLEALQKIFRKMPQVSVVYLYGSRMKGYAAKASDLDIAVVVDNIEGINYGDLILQVNQVFPELETDVRIITYNTMPTFLFQVIRDGKVIYQKSEAERVRFETKSLREYYDGQRLRDIYDKYLSLYFKGV